MAEEDVSTTEELRVTTNQTTVYVSGFAFVLWMFVFFWAQSGWYRVDCALHQQLACDLIAREYAAKDRP